MKPPAQAKPLKSDLNVLCDADSRSVLPNRIFVQRYEPARNKFKCSVATALHRWPQRGPKLEQSTICFVARLPQASSFSPDRDKKNGPQGILMARYERKETTSNSTTGLPDSGAAQSRDNLIFEIAIATRPLHPACLLARTHFFRTGKRL
ncbi:MAG: hypothetical protein AB7I42_22360 [Bradyrhizobium sp.]|uniref:hypothetical protein n=1 Tax=Bradyrhizobium sp. TaxID=376 RepID=UPI003D138A24